MSHAGKLVRTTAFRITCIYLAVFVATCLIAAAAVYVVASEVMESRVRETVEDERLALLAVFEASALEGLRASIAERVSDKSDQGFVYLLQSESGEPLAGRLPAFPVVADWHEIVPPWLDEDETFIARGTLLAGGSYLIVSHDSEELQDMLEFVEEGLIWVVALALPLALFGGLFVSAVALRRVDAINRSMAEIRGGDLSRRIPHGGTGDEFDRLALGINAMLDGIEDLTDGLRQVSQDIAHDLRTPLTRVRQKLELTAKAGADELTANALRSAIEDVDRLLDAFNALLRIAQIESGTRKKGFQTFDLTDTLQQVFDDFESVAADRGQAIAAQLDADVRVYGDKSLIVHMVVNLIENAICHTPPGTRILLQLSRDKQGVHVSVSDDGPGVPAKAQEKIFRRFYRLDVSRQNPGSGLGLSLVSAVAKLHDIGVELLDNRPGLKVQMSFPVA